MKIATYNIWNSDSGMPHRIKYIIEEINAVKADIMCLQEVQRREIAEYIAYASGYQYCYFDNYSTDEEGLCILSRYPFSEKESWFNDINAIYCSFISSGKKISVVNIHLPWNSVKERERQIVSAVSNLSNKQCDMTFITGDFNCSDSSDVQRFLNGECMLNGYESIPVWFDLALSYAELTNTAVESTMNFRANPRFINNTIETNMRYDRILLRNTYPYDFPILKQCRIFGQKVYKDINLSASDHYGVVAELKLYSEDIS